MERFWQKTKLLFRDETLRNKILFVIGALLVFRLLAVIPIPGVDTFQLELFFQNNEFLGLLNIFSGGGLTNLSIMMIGVAPYITAAIIMQLLTIMSPNLKALYQEEGEAGRAKFMQYSRLLTIPLAFIQGFGFLVLLTNQGVIPDLTLFSFITNLFMIAAGSVLIMWIGELITEFGIGNGISLIIFAGIIAALPSLVGQLLFTFDPSQIPLYLGFTIAAILVTAAVVVMTEGERRIPVTYAKQVRGSQVSGGTSTHLPIRVNQSGVMPIIFALSILLFPQMIFNFLTASGNTAIANIATEVLNILANGYVYSGIYFVLVFLFTYFYTAVTFDPDNIAKNLQRGGAFIPGVRPGQQTSQYIAKILTRVTLVGAVFLGVIAVLPLAMQSVTGVTAFALGGTGLLIVVSVALDLVRKVDAQLSIREY